MTVVRPVAAYLPVPELAAAVATPPLGGLTVRELRKLSDDNPHSFLRVIGNEIDSVGGGPDPAIPQSLGRARLDEMIAEGVLRAGPDEAFYVYGIDDGAHVAVGIVAQVHVDAYRSGQVRRHEHTRSSTETLVLDHVRRVGAQSDPVALTFTSDDAVESIIAEVRTGHEPLLDFVAGDGTHQKVWAVDDPATVETLRTRLSEHALYITDGHHRCAAAVRYSDQRREGATAPAGDPAGDADYDYFLAVLYPERELTVHEFNRCVADTGMLPAQIVAAVGAAVVLEDPRDLADADPRPAATGRATMVVGDRAWGFKLPEPGEPGDVAASLDVGRLQAAVLSPVFGIADPRTDPRLRYVAGGASSGTGAALDPGEMGCDVCFLMYPTPLDDVMRIADAGLVMPPKSTWFEPKAWGGLFVTLLD